MPTPGPQTDHPLDWEDLRTALFLGRAGSIRGAARALGVSHSTVLRRLTALEGRTGVRLFDRRAEGYQLTPAGQDVFDTAGSLDEIVSGLERRVAGRDLRLSGTVRVTLPDPFLPLLAPAFHELATAYPDIALTLAPDVGYVDLAHREADVALRVAAEPPPDLVGRRLVSAGAGVYGHERYLESRSTRDLETLDWVGLEVGSPMALERWRTREVPGARLRLRVATVAGMRDAVEAGLGVGVFPSALGSACPGWRCARWLRELSTPLWILTHRDLRTTVRVRVVRDFLADAILARRAAIEGRPRRDLPFPASPRSTTRGTP